MSHVIISRLKFQVKISAATGSVTAKKIQSLRFAPGGSEQLYRDAQGTKAGENAKAKRAARKAMLNPDSGPERHSLWVTKRAQGAETRELNLAYGFLRGIPYRVMERTTNPEKRGPSLIRIAYHINAAYLWAKTNLGASYTEVTAEDISQWMSVEIATSVAA